MVVGALALLAVPLLFGAAFQPTLLRAMTFMIVASPCAVVLATMHGCWGVGFLTSPRRLRRTTGRARGAVK